MAKPDEKPTPVNLEGECEESQDEILAAAQPEKVVRGVNGSLTPKARKLRPLAGIIVIALVVLAAAYMHHGLANRHKKTVKQTETEKVGTGPATTVEKGLLSDQARSGLDTGQSHVPNSPTFRPSILTGETPSSSTGQSAAPGNGSQTTSIPPLEYRQTPVSTATYGSLSFAEQLRLDEYNREREAMEAPTSIKGDLSGTVKEIASSASDPLAAIQSALINAQLGARAMLGTGTNGSTPSTLAQAGTPGAPEQRSDYERQNDQERKTTFGLERSKQVSEYLTTREPARGPYEIKAGWLIPAVLEQQLNSDLPGMIRALVRENVYDSATGRYILIPSGSTLIGIYNSHVGYGQNALQAVWQRIVFPDSSSLTLGTFEADDSAGAAGFRDQVNNHWGRILSGALLTSVFAAGIEVSQGTNSSVLQSESVGQTTGQAVGQQVGELGTEVTRRNLNIQPTVVVRPGYRFFVRVEKDIEFNGPYAPLNATLQGASGRNNRVVIAAERGLSGSQESSQENSQKESTSQGEP